MAYLTLQQVISAAANLDRPLAVSTFRTYVTKGQAPQPADRDGRTPLWDEDEIHAWLSSGQLPSLTRERARERWQEDNPVGDRDVAPVVLVPSHLVTLDPALPTHQAVAKAESQLEKRVLELHEAQQRLAASMPTSQADLELSGGADIERETRGVVATLLQRWNSARRDREREQHHALIQQQLQVTQRALLDAQVDLQTCRTWVADLLHWAEAEQQRRFDLLISAEVEAERLDRALTDQGRFYDSAAEFVLEDPRRLSRAWLEDRTKDDVLEDLRTTGATDATLVLSGGDFGYSWRHDGFDSSARWESPSGRIGHWRVSWNTENQELYGEDRVHNKVWLVGETPRASFSDVVNWLAPLESRQGERNSLAIVFAAFEEQRAADFPALRRRQPFRPA